MKKVFASVLALAVLALAVPGAVLAEKLPEITFEKYTLPNGLQVILHEDHTLPTVTVNTWYHVGSKNEKPGRTGFAHLFEHIMFEGSEHHPADFGFEAIGGDNNASTSEDRTNYYEVLPSNYLETALWMESDRLGYLPPAITQEKLDIQRDVVKNERRQRMDNEPYAKADELILDAVYPPDHPYSWSVIGSMADLSAASLEDVKDFFATYYTPNNASLCIAGDINPAQVKQLVEKYFASLPPGPPIERRTSWVPRLTEVRRVKAEDRVSLPRLYMVWTTPAMYAPGDAEFDVLAHALSTGKTSRLYKSLVYDKQIAQEVDAYQASNELNSTFIVEVTAKEGHTLEELEAATDAILKEVLEKGVTAAEVTEAQTAYEAAFVRSLQRKSGFGSLSDRLNNYNVLLGDPNKFQWDLDRYLKITPADVQRYAREYMDFNGRAIVQIVPQGDLAASGAEPDRSKEPAGAPEPVFSPPEIQQTKLSNGLTMLLVEKHALPLVQANLVIKNGWAADPADKPGSAKLTSELLDEGTTTRSSLQISDEAQRIGANFGTNSNYDGSYISLNVLKKNLDAGIALMTDVLLNPTFPKEELERQRQIYLGRIQQESREPNSVAQKAFARLLYGASHPYSQPSTGSGTQASIKAITRDDLTAFYKAHYVPNNAALVVVGDITLDEAKTRFEKALKDWKPGTDQPVVVPDPQPLERTRIVILDKPQAPQSMVLVGSPGVRRSDPDWPVLSVVNNALGGTFVSRLNSNLREEKGYTYGAFSAFTSRRGVAPFFAAAMVQTKVTGAAITEFLKELRAITDSKPLAGKELTENKDNLMKSYPQDFETYNALAGMMNSLYLNDLPLDEWRQYVARINGVDEAKAKAIAARHIQPDKLLIVVVGDKETIEPELKKLNIGDVQVVKPEDLHIL